MTAIDKRWFQDRMRQVGLTQDALGARLGRERTAISNILNGERKLRVDEVPAIAEALQVSPLAVLANAGIPDAAEAEAALKERRRERPVDPALLSEVIAATLGWLAENGVELAPVDLGELTSVIYDLVARERATTPAAALDMSRYASVAELVIRRRGR